MSASPIPSIPLCPICNQPVDLRDSVADSEGLPVHEDCYASQIAGKKEPGPQQ